MSEFDYRSEFDFPDMCIDCPQRLVIQCKDCKHGEKANAVYLCGKSRGFGIAHEPDWFCADGERRDNDA